jgi:hypothetical protein
MNPRRTPLEQKLGTFIRMLASERDGEVVAAAIVRTLKAAGADIHVLADMSLPNASRRRTAVS